MAIETISITDADGVIRQVSADQIDDAFAQVLKVAYGDDGALQLVAAGSPLPVADTLIQQVIDLLPVNVLGALPTIDGGTFGYDAGTSTGTVDVPTAARLKRVSVLANASAPTTVTIGGGDTITIPTGTGFDEQIPGSAVGADVIIGGGAPQSYYVSWVS